MDNSERIRLLTIKEELELLIELKKANMVNELSASLNDSNAYNYLQRLNAELGSINKKLALEEASKTR